jgi:predicted nucleic acid-binding Zn ribbon protein
MKTNSQAEVKIRKFREPLTRNGDGNPEPSLENKEGAETRHGLCKKCNGPIPAHKYKNAKFCSDRCRAAFNSHKSRVKHGLIKVPNVGSGGNQWGKNNHQYKTGIGTYSKKAFDHYGRICNRCSSEKNLLVHHINHNRSNNDLSNLEVLCKKCHQDHHCIRDVEGKFISHT